VLNLRWDDFDFENQTIRWRAEHDKKRKTWVVPMPKEVSGCCSSFARKHGGDRQRAGIPVKKDPDKAVRRHLAADLAQAGVPVRQDRAAQGRAVASVPPQVRDGAEILPLRDVADAGGWKDVGTLLKCYQLSDEETIRTVMDNPKPCAGRGPGGGSHFLSRFLGHFLRCFLR